MVHDTIDHPPPLSTKHSQLAAGVQPRGERIPLLVPDFHQIAVFLAKDSSDIPCGLLGKLQHPLQLRTETQEIVQIPKYAHFLRGSFVADFTMGVVQELLQNDSAADDS